MVKARAVLDAAIAEAEDPKSVFKQIVRPVWIGGGLWIMLPNRMRRHQLGHVFFYARQPESQGKIYRTAAQGDDKWHMRDVLGEPNSIVCQQAFDTEEEAKAALLDLVKRKGLIGAAEPRAMRWTRKPDGSHEEWLE